MYSSIYIYLCIPIGSMVLVYMLTLGGILIVNVTIYSIHMDPMGYIYSIWYCSYIILERSTLISIEWMVIVWTMEIQYGWRQSEPQQLWELPYHEVCHFFRSFRNWWFFPPEKSQNCSAGLCPQCYKERTTFFLQKICVTIFLQT